MFMLKDEQWNRQQQIIKNLLLQHRKNNSNSGASFDTDEFVYKIQLPEGVEYVNNSLIKIFQAVIQVLI